MGWPYRRYASARSTMGVALRNMQKRECTPNRAFPGAVAATIMLGVGQAFQPDVNGKWVCGRS